MQINMIRSDKVYQEMLELPLEKREGAFELKYYHLLQPNTKRNTFL